MTQTTLTLCPRKNQDPRLVRAWGTLETYPHGNLIVYKTTRAGATTGLNAESINRNEKFLCCVPTNKIADETVVRDSISYSDIPNALVIHIPANTNCIKNTELCKQYPDLKKLPILPLAEKCADCEDYDKCPVTEILRKPNFNGAVITYDKLAALMLATGSFKNVETTASKILAVLETSKNLLLDEIHEIQFGKYTKLDVYQDGRGNLIDMTKFHMIGTNYKCLRKVINEFAELMKNEKIKNGIHEVLGGAQDEGFWKHHLNISMNNPSTKFKDVEGTKLILESYKELIKLTKKRKDINLEMKDVLEIFYMTSIIFSKVLSINAIRDKGIIKINIAALNDSFLKMIRSFTMSMQSDDKRIILTSATVCSYDHGSLFLGGEKPKNISFGTGGDPMNSNSKMLILADSKKYHAIGRNSRKNKNDEIVNKIIDILQMYGDAECLIIVLGIKERNSLEEALTEAGHAHEVTYYKAPEMMGVSAKQRIMIAVGLANKPSNAFDVVTANTPESKVMLWESIHCDTWQAWSRVKDPAGKEASIVFALGCTVEECTDLTTWGYDRTVKVEAYEERQKKKVTVLCDRGSITKPVILKCNNFTCMLTEAMKHKLSKTQHLNVDPKTPNLLTDATVLNMGAKTPKSPNIYNIRRFSEKHAHSLHSSIDFIYFFINRIDAHARQCNPEKLKLQKFWQGKPIPAYLAVKTGITDRLVKAHLEGTYTIGAYQFNIDNQVTWVCFDIDSHVPRDKTNIETEDDIRIRDELAETNLTTMRNFLDNIGIPYLLEASGSPHSYHIWVFVDLVDGRIARQFALDIKKEVGIDCEVFPKQDKIDKKSGYGNLVKVPLATHQITKLKSRILINDEWTDTITDIEIGILDISKYPVPEKATEKIKAKTHIKPVAGINLADGPNVRGCISNALKMPLTDLQGHFMRMAIAREYYESGMKPEEIAMLFKEQNDFDYEFSLYQVNSLVMKPGKRFRCDRLREDGSKFITCDGCEYLGRWEHH